MAKMSLEKWMARIDDYLVKLLGGDHTVVEDYDWETEYRWGSSPKQALNEFICYYGY